MPAVAYAGRTARYRRARRRILALLALVDLVPPSLLATTAVGATLVGGPTGTFVTLAVFGLAFFEVSSRSQRRLAKIPTRALGYRLLFTASGLGFLVAVDPVGGLGDLVRPILVFGISGTLFVTYLAVFHEWRLLDPEGRSIDVFEAYAPTEVTAELQDDIERTGVLGVVSSGLLLVGLGTLLTLPPFAVGYVGRLLLFAAPVPDVLVLCWFGVISVRSRGSSRRDGYIGDRAPEERFYAVVETVGDDVAGTYTAFVAVFGLIGTVTAFAVSTVLARGLASSLAEGGVGLAWVLFGLLCVTVLAGLYGLWGWLREFERLPAFSGADWPTPTRPVGHAVVSPLAFVLVSLALDGLTTRAGLLLSTVWPLAVYVLVVAVSLTNRRVPQSVTNENRIVTATSVCHITGMWIALNPTALGRAVESGTISGVLLWPPLFLTVVLCGIGVLSETADRQDIFGQYAAPAVFCSIALVCVLLLRVESHIPRLFLYGLAAVSGVGGIALTVTSRYDL